MVFSIRVVNCPDPPRVLVTLQIYLPICLERHSALLCTHDSARPEDTKGVCHHQFDESTPPLLSMHRTWGDDVLQEIHHGMRG